MTKTLNDLLPDLQPLESVEAVWRQNNSYACDKAGNLIALSMSGSELESLVIGKDAAALEYLCLAHNENLREVVFDTPLPQLERLNQSHCALTSFKLPAGFQNLRQVYLQHNQLESLEWEGEYPVLELLDAGHNAFTAYSLPENLGGLKYLYFGDNPKLKEFTIKTSLEDLEILYLRNNALKYLPQDTILASPLQALYLAGNVPKDIPKVFLGRSDSYDSYNCLEDARLWFQDLRDFPHLPNKVVKLMLTGNGDTGKSSLVCALEKGKCEHEHESTHGVLIKTLDTPEVSYNIWDFGGQEVYHGTHRLFISSEGLQVIVFDPKTEDEARRSVPVKDRIRDQDEILNHPIQYWYETAKDLSPGSQFLIVQNKKDDFPKKESEVRQYADDQDVKFDHISARTGEDMDDLWHSLKRKAKGLPDFDMKMPQSWLKVRQFFIDNVEEGSTSRKLIREEEFKELCDQHRVQENTRDLLLRYLHHNGFLYTHQNLGDQIIADQRWALQAIYKPLDREAPHYEEFRLDWQGKIRVRRLFQVFGEDYIDKEKWLFLSFMESCGLCFKLNTSNERSRSESDIYVFPEFLPADKPEEIARFWAEKAEQVHVLRYCLPWRNYYLIQSFISAVGRKTETKNIWKNGIHVSTPDGWFKVEWDSAEKALLVFLEEKAMGKWLGPILEELRVKKKSVQWEISVDGGAHFDHFDLEGWKNRQKEPLVAKEELVESGEGRENAPLAARMPDREQAYDKAVILFIAANPSSTEKLGSQEKEHSQISRIVKGKCEVIDLFSASPAEMNNAISQYKPQIVHFCGHAEEEGLEMHDRYKRGGRSVNFQALARAFQSLKEDFPQIELVFLNACFTETTAKAISESGIFTIGTTDEVHSTTAMAFAEGFYFQYAQAANKAPDRVLLAVKHGLRQVLLDYNEDANSLIHLYHNGRSISI